MTSLGHHAGRARSRSAAFLAAIAIAVLGFTSSGNLASADTSAYYCAYGGNPEDGGTMSVGCTFGGDAGTSIAGTVDLSADAMTVAAGFGGTPGCPAANGAMAYDAAPNSLVLAEGYGGHHGSSAWAHVGLYP